jgi:Leucine-rich repeat (LRR) protein
MNTRVTDSDLQNLSGLDRLEYLSLNGTQITDAGLESLQGLQTLVMLDVQSTKVTDAALRQLERKLPHLLDLSEAAEQPADRDQL